MVTPRRISDPPNLRDPAARTRLPKQLNHLLESSIEQLADVFGHQPRPSQIQPDVSENSSSAENFQEPHFERQLFLGIRLQAPA